MRADSVVRTWLFCALLVIIGLTGSLAIDMYVPAMPAIANALHASSTTIKLSLSLYLVPFALGQLFCGPLSDCFGRKRVLMPTVVVGFAGSLLCALAPTITLFYLGRILQGLGFSAIGATLPAMARDVFDDKRFAQVGSILSMVFGLGPIFSPIVGGYISHYFGWRMIFEVTTVYSAFILLLVWWFITETHDKQQRHVFHIVPILQTYGRILKDHIFLKNTLSKSAAYTGFIVFYTVTPFMLQDHLHLTAVEYGWVTLILTGSILLAKFINTFTLNYIKIEKLIFLSLITLVSACVLLLIQSLFGLYSVAAIVIPFVIFGFGSGFLFANTTTAAFHSFKKTAAGSVSGLLSAVQLLSAFVGSAIAAHLGVTTLIPLAVFLCVITCIALIQYIYFNE